MSCIDDPSIAWKGSIEPRLKAVRVQAAEYLGVLITQAQSERIFSRLKLLITRMKTNYSDDRANKMIILSQKDN